MSRGSSAVLGRMGVPLANKFLFWGKEFKGRYSSMLGFGRLNLGEERKHKMRDFFEQEMGGEKGFS